MSWLEELDALLNKSSAEELEKLWAKYDEFDCGPEVEFFINSSMEFFYYQKIYLVFLLLIVSYYSSIPSKYFIESALPKPILFIPWK